MSDSVRCRKKLLLVAVVCLGISALFTTTRELRFCWYVAAASVAWLGWYALLECDCFYCALFTGRLFEPPKRHTPTDVVKEPAQAEALAVSTSTFAPSWLPHPAYPRTVSYDVEDFAVLCLETAKNCNKTFDKKFLYLVNCMDMSKIADPDVELLGSNHALLFTTEARPFACETAEKIKMQTDLFAILDALKETGIVFNLAVWKSKSMDKPRERVVFCQVTADRFIHRGTVMS